jgi:hypothetical protein
LRGRTGERGATGARGEPGSGTTPVTATTTDDTPTVLTNDGDPLTLENNSAWTFDILVTAKRVGQAEAAAYSFTGLIRRGASAAATVLVFVQKTTMAEDTSSWDVAVTADTGDGSLAITVTGVAAQTIKWQAAVSAAEITDD